VAKVGSAKRYAQAVFQIALDSNEVDRWRSELETIAATLGDPQLAAILEDPKVHLDDKIQLISKCLPGLNQLALNLAYLIVARQVLGILDRIVAEYNRMADGHEGLEHASVVTAVALDDTDKERLAGHLAVMTGKRVSLVTEIDPAIIGGFVARIGDKLIDGSTRARLEALRKKLVEAA
jgi:F-type H+-transporting ATPase subunit delta